MTSIMRCCALLIGKRFLCRIGVAKILSIFVRLIFGCQISPGVKIGRRFVLAYGGLGTVIHGDCTFGDDVIVGANVTLGGNFGKGGVPIVGNNVYIATGAKVLGPIRIGDDAIVAANAVVLSDVEAGCIYGGIPARKIGIRQSIDNN
jgi:serine O-acetyltransferase